MRANTVLAAALSAFMLFATAFGQVSASPTKTSTAKKGEPDVFIVSAAEFIRVEVQVNTSQRQWSVPYCQVASGSFAEQLCSGWTRLERKTNSSWRPVELRYKETRLGDVPPKTITISPNSGHRFLYVFSKELFATKTGEQLRVNISTYADDLTLATAGSHWSDDQTRQAIGWASCGAVDIRRSPMKELKLVAKFRNWRQHRASSKRVVARSAFCDESGVSQFDWLGDEEVHRRIAWDQVETVIAFKVDLIAYDDVCVALLNDRGDVLASVSEASGSFGAFINALPKWLSGCKRPDEWWDQVAYPAFLRNETELYRRCHPLC